MARLPRIVILGIPHHVAQRGNRREKTFFEDGDYALYLDLLAEAAAMEARTGNYGDSCNNPQTHPHPFQLDISCNIPRFTPHCPFSLEGEGGENIEKAKLRVFGTP
ncbi:hypothetical protein [Parasphingorhabdus halotolerans]|uniref:hypothetical protein n=1 Tax=Parasphingorhabdus halotolerans TaxID=2725558 RepID=UPI001B39DD80|nr:hypothetical protein [Parasphingorhabdus halotolerans]